MPTDDPAAAGAEPTDEPTEESEGDAAEDSDGPVPYIFDNSYDRGEPVGFYVGVGQLIPGWDDGLVGQQVGSRVLLSIPPDQGYGAQEGHDLAEDTLLFVVDIIDAFNAERAISGDTVEDLPEDLPTVSGDGVEEPTIDFSSAGEPVTESTSHLLVAGDGPELGDNLVVKVVTASVETGEVAYSSWQESRVEVIPPTDVATIPGLAEALEGQLEGSRVLTRIAAADNPGADGSEGEPIVILIDVVGSY
jgi:peptidylprolyl isomerase